MVSYSNYKRHLKNAHPSINHEEYANDDLDQTASKLSDQDAEPSELIIEEKDDCDDSVGPHCNIGQQGETTAV